MDQDTPIPFGNKHRGETLRTVLVKDPGYVEWLASMEDRFAFTGWPQCAKALLNHEEPPSRSGEAELSKYQNGKLLAKFTGPVPREFTNEIEGRYSAAGGIVFPEAQAVAAVEVLGESVWVDDYVESLVIAERERQELLDAIRTGIHPPSEVNTKIPLWDYQRLAVDFWEHTNRRCLLADDVGLGKTAIGIGCALRVPGKTLVVCPAAVKLGWAKQLGNFAGIVPAVWYGKHVVGDLSATVHVINYDLLHRRYEDLCKQNYQFVIIDEAHMVTNPKAKRTQALLGTTPRGKKRPKRPPGALAEIPWCLLLTATPFHNRPGELFTLLHYVDPQRFPSFFDYAYKYGAFPVGNLSGLPSTPTRLDHLHQRLQSVMLRRKESDVKQDRPPKLPRTEILVELASEQRKQYKQLLGELLDEWSSTRKATRTSTQAIHAWLNQQKLPALYELVDQVTETGYGIVVFCMRLEPLHELKATYGAKAEIIEGAVSLAVRQELVERFGRGEFPILAVSLTAGGTGLDGMQHGAHHVAFLDMEWRPLLLYQAEGRVARTGQTLPVVPYYFTVKDTTDEDIRDLNLRKLQVVSETIDGALDTMDLQQSVFSEFVQRLKQQFALDGDIREVV